MRRTRSRWSSDHNRGSNLEIQHLWMPLHEVFDSKAVDRVHHELREDPKDADVAEATLLPDRTTDHTQAFDERFVGTEVVESCLRPSGGADAVSPKVGWTSNAICESDQLGHGRRDPGSREVLEVHGTRSLGDVHHDPVREPSIEIETVVSASARTHATGCRACTRSPGATSISMRRPESQLVISVVPPVWAMAPTM